MFDAQIDQSLELYRIEVLKDIETLGQLEARCFLAVITSVGHVQNIPEGDGRWQPGRVTGNPDQNVLMYVEIKTWVCLKMVYTPNYSHLVGIMIINHWV